VNRCQEQREFTNYIELQSPIGYDDLVAIYLDHTINYHAKFKGCSHLVSNLLDEEAR